jgi:hypothetical protein
MCISGEYHCTVTVCQENWQRKVAVFRKIGKSRSWENVKIKPKSSIKYEGVRLIELNKTNLYVAIV